MNKYIVVLIVSMLLCSRWIGANEYYDFEIWDKNEVGSIHLRVPTSSVSKYPGWQYKRSRAFSVEVWYPSLSEKISINHWISTEQEIENSKKKPNEKDKKLSISVGLSPITSQNDTLSFENRPPKCGLRAMPGHMFKNEGLAKGFHKYVSYASVVNSNGDQVAQRPFNIKYLPNEPILGVYCISCISKANCELLGVTNLGIPYSAFYDEKEFPEKVLEIHKAVEEYLSRKVVE